MSTEAKKRADRKYNQKSFNFGIMYRPKEAPEALRLRAYLAETEESANAYFKSLIKADLDRKQVPYPANVSDNILSGKSGKDSSDLSDTSHS